MSLPEAHQPGWSLDVFFVEPWWAMKNVPWKFSLDLNLTMNQKAWRGFEWNFHEIQPCVFYTFLRIKDMRSIRKKYAPIGWLWVVIMKGIVNLLGLLADKWDRGRFHGSNDWDLRLEATKSPMYGGLYPNYTPSMEPQKTRNNMNYFASSDPHHDISKQLVDTTFVWSFCHGTFAQLTIPIICFTWQVIVHVSLSNRI